jgi:hypothetical protein
VRLRGSESHDTPWPPETPLGENPPAGAMLDYWLKDAPAGGVTLTIRDATGTLVRRFASGDRPESLAVRRSFESEWAGAPRTLSAAPGMHRFVWDLRYPRPESPVYRYSIAAVRSEGTPIHPSGPFVLPGRYTITLAAHGDSVSRALVVRLDPRVHATAQALREQLALTRTAVTALERGFAASRAIERLRSARGASLPAAVADSLARIATGDGPTIASVTENLTGLVTDLQSADGAPAQGMRNAVRECAARLDGLIQRWLRIEASVPKAGESR